MGMAASAPVNPAGWGRRRLVGALVAAAVLAVVLVAGLGYGVYAALGTAPGPASAAAAGGTHEAAVASGGAVSGRRYQDAVAKTPMLAVAPQDARAGVPAVVPAATITVPVPTRVGPTGVPTGFPHTPQGAVGQLAAIETTVLQAMSIPVAVEVYDRWAQPGGVGPAGWELTGDVRAYLGSRGAQDAPGVAAGSATGSPAGWVTVVPVGAQVKGTDGPDWVLGCVLLDVRAVIVVGARIGYGNCERLHWDPAAPGPGGVAGLSDAGAVSVGGGRWVIGSGSVPARAPSTWPGTELAARAGWRTWVDAGRG